MKDQDQIFAIAKAAGYRDLFYHTTYKAWYGTFPNTQEVRAIIPDYLTNYNEIRKVILSALPPDKADYRNENSFWHYFIQICAPYARCPEDLARDLLFAAPHKLAEAFLKTLGEWKD